MTLEELKPILRKGKLGIIPNWSGYLKYDYFLDQLYFENNNYKISQKELEKLLNNRKDIYYII